MHCQGRMESTMRITITYLSLVAMVTSYVEPPQQIRYDGHKVLNVLHKTEEDFLRIIELISTFDLDIWSMPKHPNDTTHVRVAPEAMEQLMTELEELDVETNIFIEDIQSHLDEHGSEKRTPADLETTKRARPITMQGGSGMELNVYHTHNSIRNFLHVVENADLPYGVSATLEDIGSTYEGRHMEIIKISTPTSSNGVKHGIFIDGGIHAREWIAPATVLYMIEQLAYNPDNDPALTALLDKFDFYLLPVVNPDGYEYTEYERFWRKNRNTRTGSTCVGVDLNRNFPFHWDPATGGSTNPCNDIYSGSGAGSELETTNLVNYLLRRQAPDPSYMVSYLTLHSYGQMWLYPWGYTSALPQDWHDLHSAAERGIRAIQSVGHMKYTIGSSTRVLYSAAGGSDDFAKGRADIKYSYTLELRDMGRYAFSLPTSMILPTGQETWQGIKAFLTQMASIEGW